MSDYPDFPTYIDSSMLGTFKACPRKFYYQYLLHLSPVEKSIHLVAGGAFAKGLEVARMAFHRDKLTPEESVHAGQIAALSEWGDYPYKEDNAKNLGAILLAIEEYFRRHGFATDPIQPFMYEKADGNPVPAVEFSFALPLGINHPQTGEPLLYCGRFDLLGVYNNTLFAVDEKTTTRLGPTWCRQWDLRSQFTGYCWAAKEYGYPVAGAIVRGMSILKNDYGFAEAITYRQDHDIQRWLETTYYYITQMIQAWKDKTWIHNLDDSCNSYGGCSFSREVCDKRNPEEWLDTNFVIRKWSPIEVHSL